MIALTALVAFAIVQRSNRGYVKRNENLDKKDFGKVRRFTLNYTVGIKILFRHIGGNIEFTKNLIEVLLKT